MAVQQAVVTQGTTLYRLSDDRTWEKVNGITSFNGPNVSKNKIDVSTFASTRREYIYGLADEGDISMNAFFYPSDRVHRMIMTQDVPSHDNRDWRLELSDGTAYEFSGNLTGAPISGEMDGAVAWSLTLSISGEPTWTFGAGIGSLAYTYSDFVGDKNTFAADTGIKDPFDGAPITRGRVHGILYIDLKDVDITTTHFIDPHATEANGGFGSSAPAVTTLTSSQDYDSSTRKKWVTSNWGSTKVYTHGVHYSVTFADGTALSTAKLSPMLVYQKKYATPGARVCLLINYDDAQDATGTALNVNSQIFKFKLLKTAAASGNDSATQSIISGVDDPTADIVGAAKDITVQFGNYQAKVVDGAVSWDKKYRTFVQAAL